METTDRIAEFKAFFNDHLEAERASIEAEANETAAFLDEYPLARIRELTFEEYCLGTEKSKDSFCYSIEFGKYCYARKSFQMTTTIPAVNVIWRRSREGVRSII